MPEASGVSHRTRRSVSSVSMVWRRRTFSAEFCSTVSGESPVRCGPLRRQRRREGARDFDLAIQQIFETAARILVHGFISARVRTATAYRQPGGIDVVGACAQGLLHGGDLRRIHHGRPGDGFFDLLQRAGGVGEGDGVAGLRAGCTGAWASLGGLSVTTPLLFEPLTGATGSAVEYALILSVTEILLGQALAHAKVIVRVWMNFSGAAQDQPSRIVIDCDALH